MNDSCALKDWLEIGNEVEFSFNSREYSITYGNDVNGKRYISLCEFNEPETRFYSVADFLSRAKIEGIDLCELWASVTDVTVY